MTARADAADYIVIGGGSAGCVLAGRLSEAPDCRVALLEAGGEEDGFVRVPLGIVAMLPTRIHNYGFATVPQDGLGGRRGYQPRGRGLGGSSALNAMIYVRGHPWDYDHWAALGNDGWSYADLLPYFLRSEGNERLAGPFHNQNGPLAVSDLRSDNHFVDHFLTAAEQAGFRRNDDFNGAEQEGVGRYQVTQAGGRRCSAARAYLLPHRGRANLRVETRARVERILIEGGRAVGVDYRRHGEPARLLARREVLLAAGAVHSPQILMLSGIGDGAQLQRHGIDVRHHLPAVGADLQDHPDFVFAYRARDPDLIGFSPGGALRLAGQILRYRRQGRGVWTSNVAEAGGFLRSEPRLPAPDLQLHFVVGILDDHGRRLHAHSGFSCHVCLLRPRSRGSVGLAGPDPRRPPLIDPGFYRDEADLAAMVVGFRLTRRLLDAPALASRRGRELFTQGAGSDEEIAALLRRRTDTVYHPVGSCRMGADSASVVDPRLRLRGVAGLRVVDGSIMPTLIGGNSNAPIIAIAEKAVDLIRADQRRPA